MSIPKYDNIPRRMRRRRAIRRRIPSFISKTSSFLLLILIPQILLFISPNNVKNDAICNLQIIPQVHASGILTNLVSSTYELLFPPDDYIDENDDFETTTLNIVEISELRARDIKRRLARKHGYDPEELSKMIDKKDLINALSFEEHKSYTREVDRRKWIRFKNTVIYTCAAIIVVMFWPLLKHALEVASVNFVVYTDRRKHEIRRCHELYSYKGYFGIFILFIIDILSFWLSVSVLLSWVMSSKYFFPTPNIPIRPAQLLTPKGHDAGALGQYGINVGPMIIRFAFKFLNDKVESMIGRAMVEAVKREKRREKEILKQARKEEKAKEKEARREARRQAEKAKEEKRVRRNKGEAVREDSSSDECSEGEQSYSGMTASNVVRSSMAPFENADANTESYSAFNELD